MLLRTATWKREIGKVTGFMLDYIGNAERITDFEINPTTFFLF